jgi:hypothetical protein
MELLKRILPHVCIILSGMMLIFVVIDKFNAAMGLVNNDITKALLLILSILVIVISGMLIKRQRQED